MILAEMRTIWKINISALSVQISSTLDVKDVIVILAPSVIIMVFTLKMENVVRVLKDASFVLIINAQLVSQGGLWDGEVLAINNDINIE